MKPKLLTLIFLLSAWSNGAGQQRATRPAKPPDTGPVAVARSSTLQVLVASDAVSVFSYLSDQRKLTAWMADQAILEPQMGAKFHFRWKNQEPVDGVVTEFAAANTLALTWKHPSDTADTRLRFKVSPQGGNTMVVLELQGYTSPDSLEKDLSFWVFNLKNLKSVIEEQIDLRQAPKAPARAPIRRRTG